MTHQTPATGAWSAEQATEGPEVESAATVLSVASWLLEIPELAALLDVAEITRTPNSGPRSAPASRPPVNLTILVLVDERTKWPWETGMAECPPARQGVLPYLTGWARDLEADAYDAGLTPPELADEATLSTVCGWLTSMLLWAATLTTWSALADGIRHTREQLLTATANVRDVEHVVPCRNCGGPLHPAHGTTPSWMCDDCGNLVTVQAVTINQAAKIIGIQKDRLYGLVNRPGLLNTAGIARPTRITGDTGARKLYDLNDLRRLVAEVRLREIV